MGIEKLTYGVEDIRTLEGIEAIRTRPGMYIGDVGLAGVYHITLEIISNVIDEYLNGHCDTCQITVDNNNIVSIYDNGRGIPFGRAEDGSETLENIFTKLHTGAKFDSSGKTGYNTSGGMNGVGAKATNALSDYFSVQSIRDGKKAVMTFKQGIRQSFTITNCNEHSGTLIIFHPDIEIFKEGIDLDYTRLHNQIKELAYLSPGLTFTFTYKDKETETLYSKNGVLDYLSDLTADKKVITSTFSAEAREDRVGVKLAMSYNDSYSDSYKLYTNSIPNTSGTHLTGFRTALTQCVNAHARANKLLKDKDDNLTGEELKEGLTLVLSFFIPDPVFSGQTKEVLTSSEARTIVQRLVAKELITWLDKNPKDARTIVDKALLARAAREKAKKAKEAVRNTSTTGKNSFLNLPTKLVDCWSKDRKKCELLICEGDSAMGGLVEGRDSEFQAIFPIRGKIISLEKNSNEKIFQNQEVLNIIKALGLELDAKTHKLIYDINKLRYGKVIMACDGDPDGEAIKNLLIAAFWNLCPELVINGHLCAAIPPLFRITTRKNEYIYVRDAVELENYKAKHQGEKFQINRNKGLGEQDAEELSVCLLNPETRNMVQLVVDDAAETNKLIEILMGPSVPPRREYLLKHSEEANI